MMPTQMQNVSIVWATILKDIRVSSTLAPMFNQTDESLSYLEDSYLNLSPVKQNLSVSIADEIEAPHAKIGVFLAGLIVTIITIVGNFMVVLAVVIEKRLQTPFNYYIVNLALADGNVGVSVMSIYTGFNFHGYFPWSRTICNYWVWSDYTMTFESVITLTVIR